MVGMRRSSLVLCALTVLARHTVAQGNGPDTDGVVGSNGGKEEGDMVECQDANVFGLVSCVDLNSYGWCTEHPNDDDDFDDDDDGTKKFEGSNGELGDHGLNSDHLFFMKAQCPLTCGFCAPGEMVPRESLPKEVTPAPRYTTVPHTRPPVVSTVTTKAIKTQLAVRTVNVDTTTTTTSTTSTASTPATNALDTADGDIRELGAAEEDAGQEIQSWKLALGVAGCILTGVLLVVVGSGMIRKRKREQRSADGFAKALDGDEDFMEDTSSIGSSLQSIPMKTVKIMDHSNLHATSMKSPYIFATTTSVLNDEPLAAQMSFAVQEGNTQQADLQGQACQMPRANVVKPSPAALPLATASASVAAANPPSALPIVASQAAVAAAAAAQAALDAFKSTQPVPSAAAAAAAAVYPGLANPANQSMFAIQPPQNIDIQRDQWATLLSAANAAVPVGWHMAMHPQQIAQATWKAQAAASASVAKSPVRPEGTVDSATQYARGFGDAMRLAAAQHQQQLLAQQQQAQVHAAQVQVVQQQHHAAPVPPKAAGIVSVVAAPPTAVEVEPGTIAAGSAALASATSGSPTVSIGNPPKAAASSATAPPARSASANVAPVPVQPVGHGPAAAAASPALDAETPNPVSRLLRVDDVWQNWALVLGAKDRNDLIRRYGLTKLEAEDLKRTSRRMKQNMAQQRYLRRQRTVEEIKEDMDKEKANELNQPHSPGAQLLAAPPSPANSVSSSYSSSSSSSAGVDSILEAARVVAEEEPAEALSDNISTTGTGTGATHL